MNATITVAGVPVDDAVQAAFLQDLGNAARPRDAFLAACEKHQLAVNVGRILANRAGYPDRNRLLREAAHARNRAGIRDTGPRETVTTPALNGSGPAESGTDAQVDEKPVLVTVRVDSLQGDPENPREHLGNIEELAESITAVGLLEPIVVRRRSGNILSIVAGHRRRAALLHLGVETTEVLLKPIPADDVLLAMLIENGQREDLDPIAEARGIAKLKARFGLTDMEAGKKLGRSQPWVSGRLALLELSPEDQAAIRAGTMSLTRGTAAGRQVSGHHRPNAKGKVSAAHLAFNHPLAAAAEACCRQLGHNKHTPGRVGGIACGQCWEAVIRSDERNKLTRGRQADLDLRAEVEKLRDEHRSEGREAFAAELDYLLEGTPA